MESRPSTPIPKISSSKSLRVLIVDDNPNDRALVIRELQRDFPGLIAREAPNPTALQQSFAAGAFDLVVTDYQLYWSDGLQVLHQVKKMWPDCAVIMFTGTGNEEIAVEAMRGGVDDYVLKTPANFERLRTSAKKAFELRQQQREKESAEHRYQALFDTVPVGLFRSLPSGKILDANPALANMLGFANRSELIGENFSSFHPHHKDFCRWREQLEREGSVAFFESQFKTRAGEVRTIEIHARALRDPETRQIVYEGSVEDITLRKKAEQEREKLIAELQENCAKIKTLTGLLPICASCKKIRDEQGAWNLLEAYIEHHSNAHFTHSFCPDCVRRLYPEVFLDMPKL